MHPLWLPCACGCVCVCVCAIDQISVMAGTATSCPTVTGWTWPMRSAHTTTVRPTHSLGTVGQPTTRHGLLQAFDSLPPIAIHLASHSHRAAANPADGNGNQFTVAPASHSLQRSTTVDFRPVQPHSALCSTLLCGASLMCRAVDCRSDLPARDGADGCGLVGGPLPVRTRVPCEGVAWTNPWCVYRGLRHGWSTDCGGVECVEHWRRHAGYAEHTHVIHEILRLEKLSGLTEAVNWTSGGVDPVHDQAESSARYGWKRRLGTLCK